MVRPRAFAVLRLMTNSNFVGSSTGRSPGLAVASGLLAGQCLSLADYVAVTGTRGGATAAGGPFMLPSLPACVGAAFERWVTPAMAHRDLLRCSLVAFPN